MRCLPRAAVRQILLGAAAAAACAAAEARADVVDLTGGGARRGGERPPMLVLKLLGGSGNAPFGKVGGCLSYLNEATLTEVELGAGAGFPGTQLGGSLRKLFGDLGDYIVFELSIAGNTRTVRGRDPLNPASGTHVWTNLGIGFEHRTGAFSFGVAGGGTFISFTQTPEAYAYASLGLGF
jgi:hypothetical protein